MRSRAKSLALATTTAIAGAATTAAAAAAEAVAKTVKHSRHLFAGITDGSSGWNVSSKTFDTSHHHYRHRKNPFRTEVPVRRATFLDRNKYSPRDLREIRADPSKR